MTERERLSIVAHEVRSPVAALQALAEQGAATPIDLGRVAVLAVAAGCDIERLLSDPDLLSLRPTEIELSAVLDLLARPRVSCSSAPVMFVCDPTRLRQAVGNLVANGLRHGTTVTVVGRRDGNRVVVSVSDDGPGLAAGVRLFARGVSGVGSSGYGLWLARGIARAHGGDLIVESPPRTGATFKLWVPLSPVGRG
jgi:signal transduction histidine kinase